MSDGLTEACPFLRVIDMGKVVMVGHVHSLYRIWR
jgi:hypothetical protein